MKNNINNINEIKVGQRIWWYGKYGDLMGGDKGAIVTKVEPKAHEYNGIVYDSFSFTITKREFIKTRPIFKEISCKTNGVSRHKKVGDEIVNKWETRDYYYGVSIQGNQIYSKNPTKEEK